MMPLVLLASAITAVAVVRAEGSNQSSLMRLQAPIATGPASALSMNDTWTSTKLGVLASVAKQRSTWLIITSHRDTITLVRAP